VSPDGGGSFEADLVAWGKVVVLETTGRRSGRARRVHVGFVEAADGSLLIAASGPSTQWAQNLIAEPDCVVELVAVRRSCRAQRLEGPAAHTAIAELILKYGTPSESLGAGPAFRLHRREA
jgi:deazaflavin-dependent oxidoreductase (nitroreductase family)